MTRPFSSSAVAQEKKRKRLARLKKSANLSKREAIQQQLAATQPDALLGYHDASIWDQSKLKAAILTREQVWDTSAAGKQATSTRTAAASLDEGLDQDVDYSPPAQFNFGLDAADAELLFQRLPAVSALRPVLAAQNSKDYDSSHLAKLHEQGVQEEDRKKEQLMRILDLKNANARGIRVENTKRLLEAFGRTKAGKGPDTGSPEVQAAVMTLRIHNIRDHLIQMPKDKHSQRAIRLLINKRNNLLQYLKRVSVERYTAALSALGLESRAVEGEFVYTQEQMRGLRALQV